jgi:YebC/PmpR family DNA-binding regulatory protein
MSGHSKWSTIKRKKGAEDAKRGKIFTRLAKEITIAAREGGGDDSANPRLKLAISRAKAANMPKENIERAIKRGTGELEGGQLEEITYEGYGIDGVAFIVEVLTDNRNRALAEVKSTFNKNGGNLATSGAVAWQFEQKGYIEIASDGSAFDDIFTIAAEAGADDVIDDEDGIIVVYTPREAFRAVEQALAQQGYMIGQSQLQWESTNPAEIDTGKAVQNMRLMERLEELDDVQTVASNLLITEALAQAYEEA